MQRRNRWNVVCRQSVYSLAIPAITTLCFLLDTTESVAQSAAKAAQQATGKRTPPRKSPLRSKTSNKISIVKNGTSSEASQTAAKKLVPTLKVAQDVRPRIDTILKSTSLYRELPSLRFEVDPRTYLYFASHPDVAVSIWRAMGISKFKLQQKSGTLFVADGGDGTKGDIEIVFRGPGHVLVICNGVYKNPLLVKPVKTQSLLHLQATFHKAKDGRTFVTHRVFLHVAFPSMAVETAAKLLSPVSNMILDRNFQEISLFLHVMSKAMARQPGWVEKIAARMEGVDKMRKAELLNLTAQAYVEARKREGYDVKKPTPRTAARRSDSRNR